MASEQYQLDRQSTALKKAGDFNGAIAALRKRKALLGVLYDDTKLAKYLQEAGFFEEAMAEIEWLIATTPERVARITPSPTVSPITRQAQQARFCGSFHRTAALLCKRQGLPDLRKHHETVADQFFATWEHLNPIGNEDSAVLSERYRVEMKERSRKALERARSPKGVFEAVGHALGRFLPSKRRP
jgi:hypothetical protein